MGFARLTPSPGPRTMTTATVPAKPRSTARNQLARAERTATDDLKKAVAEIRAEVGKLTSDNIKTRWQIGHRIVEIVNDRTGKYGTDPRAEIDALMPLSRDGIRPMVKLAENFDEPEIDKMLAHRHPTTGEGITWTHIAALTRVKDKTAVLKYAETAVTKGWSSKDLVNEIVSDNGGAKSKGGRKPAKAETLRACLGAIDEKAVGFINAAKMWLGNDGIHDLYDKERATTDLEHRLQVTLDNLDAMATQLRTVAAELSAKGIQTRNKLRAKVIQ